MNTHILTFAIALIASLLLVPLVKRLAKKIGAIDVPDSRKVHSKNIPRIGGLAIYAGFILAIFLTVEFTTDIVALLIGGTLIVILGLLDDVYQLPAKVKLFGQIFAAGVLIFLGIEIEAVTNPFGGYIFLGYFSIPVTLIWIVSLTNVVNLMDGLDGLAAGVATIASVSIIYFSLEQGFYPVSIIATALAGSTLGFMKYNFNPATIFMGDTGSMFLGYMLAAISIFGAAKTATTISLVIPALALGLPIMDTAFAIIRRYSNGKPIFAPDKGHLHHRLLAMGMSQKQTVLLIYVFSAILGFSAILLADANRISAMVIIGVIFAVVFVGAKKIGILDDTDSVKMQKNTH